MSSALRRLRWLMVVALLLTVLAILWRLRPEWPELPNSLSSPVTTALLKELALVAAWLLTALVTLLLLVESLKGIRERQRTGVGSMALTATFRSSARLPRPAGVRGILHALPAEPRLLVAAPREATPAPLTHEFVATSSMPATASDTETDGRPLISLLGPLTIDGGKRSRRGLRARALELIAFLALRREGAQRDEILEALWPGEDPERSRHRLYQAVRDARRLLGDGVASERDRYWLDRTHVRVDADELEELLKEPSEATDSARRMSRLERALALFHAEPLAGCDYAWAESDVRSLRGAYVELLEQVGRGRLEAGEALGALEAAERALAVDVLNESPWRLALEAEAALGLRESVIGRYETLTRLLDERLGLEPDRRTRSIYLLLLGQT